MNKVIELKCDVRSLLISVATESVTLNTAVQMGLLTLLDTLAARASVIDDPEASKVLRILGLTEPSNT